MNHDMTRLRDQIVFLEVLEARHVGMNAANYLAVARSVREIIQRELGELTMQAFVSAVLPTLQTTAENIYFDTNRRFADLDGSGNASRAQAITDSLMRNLGRA